MMSKMSGLSACVVNYDVQDVRLLSLRGELRMMSKMSGLSTCVVNYDVQDVRLSSLLVNYV